MVVAQSGRDVKDDVYFTYDVNVSLTAAPPAQNGVAAPPNKSYLLTAQVNAAENGAYIWDGTSWLRREDSDTDSLSAGATYPTVAGKFAGMLFMLTTAEFVLDTDPLTFMNSSDLILDGDGLERDGRILHVRGKAGQIQVSANEVAIASDFAGLPSISVVGTIASGVWNATEIGLEFGGTGSKNLQTAQQNLGIQATVLSILGNGTATSFDVVHGLNNIDLNVAGTYQGQSMAGVDYTVIDSNTIRVKASLGETPIPANSLRVTISAVRNGANVTTVAATAIA